MESVTFKIEVRVNQTVKDGHHGISLLDSGGKLIWGTATNNLKLDPGVSEFVYTLPTLPLRPGAYYWQVSLWEEGKLLDIWNCTPELVIGTEPLTHPRDEGTGMLNLPCEFRVNRL